jgi:hypothetical protein
MKIKFREIKLSPDNQVYLTQVNRIIIEYQAQGMPLTLRQLYYQLVSRGIIPNRLPEYSKLSKVLKEGRMSGVVDWDAIEDRLRSAEKPPSWGGPAEIIESAINSYAKHRMEGQENYIEVWVEKDALSGVLSIVTEEYHIPICVNRGYSSASAMFDSYKRFKRALEGGQKIVILYLGDYDPSGVDMIRDVKDRPLEMLLSRSSFIEDVYEEWIKKEHDGDWQDAQWDLEGRHDTEDDCYIMEEDDDENEMRQFEPMKAFIKERFEVVSIALTRAQIRQYRPPPNPAKKTDPRAKDFIEKHGHQSWEVDALRPEVLNDLLRNAILARIDFEKYQSIVDAEDADKDKLRKLKEKL